MTTPTGVLFYDGRAKPLDVNGVFQPGCYVCFFQTGTLTPTNVYADGLLTTPLSQPTPASVNPTGGTVAASDGRFVPMYLDPSVIYRYQMFNALGSLLEDVDPFVAGPNLSSFVTTSALTATLASYVLNTQLTAALASLLSISTAAATYMPLAGGTFTGAVNGITPAPGDNSTLLATTAFVQSTSSLSGSSTSYSFTIGTTIINGGFFGPSLGGGGSPTANPVTFHTAYPTACRSILVTSATPGASIGTSTPSASNSGFNLFNGVAGAFTSWLAIGN
jgi:hypothetical protein